METIFFPKNYKFLLTAVVFLFLLCPVLSADEAQPEAKDENVMLFEGVGTRSTEVDPSLYKSDEVRSGNIEAEKSSTIKLSPGMQKVADDAGKTIKNIDHAMLDSINQALHLLHIEAESAKVRPKDGGVGLGISINLDKGKKQDEKDDAKASKGDSGDFYDLFRPSDSQH